MLKNKYLLLPLMILLHIITPNSIEARRMGPAAPAQAKPPVQVPQPVQVKPPVQVQPPAPIQPPAPGQPSLSDIGIGSASVLPVFIGSDNKKYCLFGREAAGRDKGTYDDFGGEVDPGETPLVASAREFWEEANLELTIGFSLQATMNFIDTQKALNTEYVIVNADLGKDTKTGKDWKPSITYVTDFTQHIKTFFGKFYEARAEVPTKLSHLTAKEQWARQEKDSLAYVELDELKKTIIKNTLNTGVTVSAILVTPQGGLESESITLRPFFVKKLRPFFEDKPYQQGTDKKIRFYGRALATPETRQQCIQRCQQQCPQQ